MSKANKDLIFTLIQAIEQAVDGYKDVPDIVSDLLILLEEFHS